jgi:uncharacterized protein
MQNTVMSPPSLEHQTASTSPDLVVRQLLVDLKDGFPRHWNGGDAFLTQYYNAFSMSFPEGEQSFIDAVRMCLPLLPLDAKYDKLRADAKDFIGQEANHRRVHEQFNAVLAQQGLHNTWQHRIVKRLAWSKTKKIHPLNYLATTVAYEHMTAVFADLHLSHPDLLAKATPQMQALWRWHSAEESEHRALAFDLYQACGGNYRNRMVTAVIAMSTFYWDSTRQTVSNLWHDKTLFKPSTAWSALNYFWHPKTGLTWAVLKPFASFVRRDFHPWKDCNQAASADWLNSNQLIWRALKPAQ